MAELVYEMVWDCRSCGAPKLLGLTHRHCPSCGAPQDPNTRYFPADHEKVAVQNHEFVGADISCRYCSAPSPRHARYCGQCGATLVEGGAIMPQAAPPSHEMAYAAGPLSEPPNRPLWKVALPIAALLAVVVTVLLLVWKREQRFVVAELAWARTVTVERLGPARTSAWCDELPADVHPVSRRREQRRSQQAPGEEPVYAEKCTFDVMQWGRAREERTEGRLETSAPRWPSVSLSGANCDSAGCEREGPRSESYTVVFKDAQGEPYRCNFDERAWRGFAPNARYAGKLRAFVGSLDCGSLEPAR